MTGTSLWPWLDDFKWPDLEVFTSKPRREVDLDVLPLKSRRGMLGAALISAGLVGALAWVWWRRRQASELAPVLAATPSVFAESAPRLVPIALPQTAEELDEILKAARTCLAIAPNHPDHELASLAWGFIWKGVSFPGRPRPGDHPSIGQALDIVLHAIAVERAEARDREVVAAPAKRPAKPIAAVSIEVADLAALTSESPTPGCLYELREGDELLGVDGLAAMALRSAVVEAAANKRWPLEKIEAHATKLAGKAAACAAYVDLIRKSKWNVERLEPLRAGALLWLPPLHQLPSQAAWRRRRHRAERETLHAVQRPSQTPGLVEVSTTWPLCFGLPPILSPP